MSWWPWLTPAMARQGRAPKTSKPSAGGIWPLQASFQTTRMDGPWITQAICCDAHGRCVLAATAPVPANGHAPRAWAWPWWPHGKTLGVLHIGALLTWRWEYCVRSNVYTGTGCRDTKLPPPTNRKSSMGNLQPNPLSLVSCV